MSWLPLQISVAISCASTVDAAAVVGDACSRVQAGGSVDVSVTGTERWGDTSETVHMEYRIGSNDVHWTTYDSSRNVMMEVIAVGSSIYARFRGEGGVLGPWEDQTPPASGSGSTSGARGTSGSTERAVQDTAPPTFCGFWPLEDVEYLGTATIGEANTSVKHFRISQDHTDLGGGVGSYETVEYWIDSSGEILQASIEFLETGENRSEGFAEPIDIDSG